MYADLPTDWSHASPLKAILEGCGLPHVIDGRGDILSSPLEIDVVVEVATSTVSKGELLANGGLNAQTRSSRITCPVERHLDAKVGATRDPPGGRSSAEVKILDALLEIGAIYTFLTRNFSV